MKINTKKDGLTDKNYWEESYIKRTGEYNSFDKNDWKDLTASQIFKKISNLIKDRKNILEAGGGDGKFISALAKENKDKNFFIIDYSEKGCELAAERAYRENVQIKIFKNDIFNPPENLINFFDFIFSFGVAEHFTDLKGFLSAKKNFLKQNGIMFTLIPNLKSPVYGKLCKSWNMEVYNSHIIHDAYSLKKGHEEAGLKVKDWGYFGSIEFGMLSMAIVKSKDPKRINELTFLWLTRISKLIHLFEYFIFRLPPTSLFSPFIYVVSEKETL